MRISDWSSDVCSSDLCSPCAAFCVQGGEQAEPYRHDSGSDDRENAVTADPAYDLATNDGSYEDAAHHRRELETRSGWANPLHHLKVDRHICHGAKHRQTDDEADSAGDDEGLVGKQRQWQYRFSGSVLDEDEACERHHGDGNHSKNDRRIPGEAVSAQTSEKDQIGRAHV